MGQVEQILDSLDPYQSGSLLVRKLQRYIVTIPKAIHQKLLASGRIQEIPGTGIYKQTVDSLYDSTIGFLADAQDPLDPEDFIC